MHRLEIFKFKKCSNSEYSNQIYTAVEEIVGAKHQVGHYRFEGMEKPSPFPRFCVRKEYLKTMGITFVAGQYYDLNIQTDDGLILVVNKKFVDIMHGLGGHQKKREASVTTCAMS
ncbi:MAG: hypothetical protein ACI9A7_001366 [Cyclobacteriaceae bacterium]